MSFAAVLVAQEVARAAEAQRALDLVGRACVVAAARDSWEAVAERAQERAAITGESGVGVGGLVSLPTSVSERSGRASAARSVELRKRIGAVAPDVRAARIGRLRRAVGFAARSHLAGSHAAGFRADYVAMLTLTYRGGSGSWMPDDLSKCLRLIRRWMERRGVSPRYVWVAELQKRGVIHYHVALWLPAGMTIPKPDRRAWWPHGASNIKQAQKPVAYLMKYCSKGQAWGEFPKGARTHGAGGLDFAARRAKRWLGLPSFVKARADIFDDWGRAAGGGWHDPDGVVIPSEFVRVWAGDRYACLRVCDYGRPFEVDGPYTRLDRRGEVSSH